jgi:hypothetical protein
MLFHINFLDEKIQRLIMQMVHSIFERIWEKTLPFERGVVFCLKPA